MPSHPRACHVCEANCGLIIQTGGRRVVSIRGDANDSISRGHIGFKGNAIANGHHFSGPTSDPALLIGLLLALDDAGLVS